MHELIGRLQGIAASPYLIAQYDYNATAPTQRYNDFAKAAGCANSTDKFACLVAKDSMTLQRANFNVTNAEAYGLWAFWPVTDGAYVKRLPSLQMAEKKVNGVNMFVGVSSSPLPRTSRAYLAYLRVPTNYTLPSHR